jgi:broad specificity phosphatase PhoE
MAAPMSADRIKSRLEEVLCIDKSGRSVTIKASADISSASSKSTMASDTKVVHWIRHGQGFHNSTADLVRALGVQFSTSVDAGLPGSAGTFEQAAGVQNPYMLDWMADPPLTQLGRDQAASLQLTARTLNPELVVVSPLSRAVKTALIGFDHLVDGAATKVPFVANELVRETNGKHTCDRRRETSEAARDFPMVDFSALDSKEDPTWTEQRETSAAISCRGYSFLTEWLRQRPEKEIVVATHSAFLLTVFNSVLDCSDCSELTSWFETGEMRSTTLTFKDIPSDA